MDKFFPSKLNRIFPWIMGQEKSGQVFGIPAGLFFKPSLHDPFRLERFDQTLENPLGVAAGPHTQLSQNIVSAWLSGARFIELKTVQNLDRLTISKPCIDMEDEGYNCEWSQELPIIDSFHQYLDAWIILHLLRHHFGWVTPPGPGFIFNISVGYSMKGILSDNVRWFLEKMENCHMEKELKLEQLSRDFPWVKNVPIPDCISNNVTLSTMHGCPPEEIELIARYLIDKRKLHTTIKLNPTLLGPLHLRHILGEILGFDTDVPDEAFNHDLKYEDAVSMIRSLLQSAAAADVHFGLKLSNTLESINNRSVFSPREKMMYMSGRALHPITVNLAAKLQDDFKGTLDISFSAGADCFNFPRLIACGLKPVTGCSDLLKPGGYGRMAQYIDELRKAMTHRQAASTADYIRAVNEEPGDDPVTASLKNLKKYAKHLISPGEERFKKSVNPGCAVKTGRALDFFDCFQAPCTATCPAHQDVPGYMFYTRNSDYQKALDVILKTNPFPAVTGSVCDHTCMTRCTRINYDTPICIRDIKSFISRQSQEELPPVPHPPIDLTAAVIGAGPSGLACAYYLALQGVDVHIYETQNEPGGMISEAIPTFRLDPGALRSDIQRIENLGVTIHYNSHADQPFFNRLRNRFNYIYIAVGAWKSLRLNIPGEKSPYVTDAVSFLSRVKRNLPCDIGKKVAVVGGGNSAVDAARAAVRLLSPHSSPGVTVIYRRSILQMPAAREEIQAARDENIKILELATPVKIQETPNADHRLKVTCCRMKLGEKDQTGRQRPVPIENSDFDLAFDTVISAVGQEVVLDFLDEPLKVQPGSPVITGNFCGEIASLAGPGGNSTIGEPIKKNFDLLIKFEPLKIPPRNRAPRQWASRKEPPGRRRLVLIGGDARRGAANIISAIADGKNAADTIMEFYSSQTPVQVPQPLRFPLYYYQERAAKRDYGNSALSFSNGEDAQAEASRCLLCGDYCGVCVTVCPNRANVLYPVSPLSFMLKRICFDENGEPVMEDDRVFQVQQSYQVLNIADFCNHCGNCDTFCPTSGAPYKNKPRLCLSHESFQNEEDAFFIEVSPNIRRIMWKQEKETRVLTVSNGNYCFETPVVKVELSAPGFDILSIEKKSSPVSVVSLLPAAIMRIIFDSHITPGN